MIYFVSGHGNTTFEEFLEHYVPVLEKALKEKASFIIGDFKGTDILTAEYLKDKTLNVTICHMYDKPRYKPDASHTKVSAWVFVGQFKSDVERDSYMTDNSDADIAWIRPGREGSKKGTWGNLERRKQCLK